MSRPVLVTGAHGFLGRALARHVGATWPRRPLVLTTRRRNGGPRCDFSDGPAVLELIGRVQPGLIFHAVGTTEPVSWPHLFAAHVTATANLLEAVRIASRPFPRIVLFGSAAEYGNVPPARQPISEVQPCRPTSPYGVSKLVQTSLAQAYAGAGVPVMVARLFNVLAGGMPDHFAAARFARLIMQARRRPASPVAIGSLNAVRDFLPLEEVCRAAVAVATKGRPGEVYNVCSGRAVRMQELFDEMARRAGGAPRITRVGPGSPRTDVPACVGSPRKIRRHAGWLPRLDWRSAIDGVLAAV
jgi:GDP-4-dehydro-6-deoxy-D-mannose reductase